MMQQILQFLTSSTLRITAQRQLQQYLLLLMNNGQQFNLVSRTTLTPAAIMQQHFYDSALLLQHYSFNSKIRLLDMGSGAGLPGIVLKVLRPVLKVTLLESNIKKARFLTTTINNLQLQNVTVINGRAETVVNRYAGQFDVVVVRAVGKAAFIIALSCSFLTVGGYIILYKGQVRVTEYKQMLVACQQLGCQLRQLQKVQDPWLGTRS